MSTILPMSSVMGARSPIRLDSGLTPGHSGPASPSPAPPSTHSSSSGPTSRPAFVHHNTSYASHHGSSSSQAQSQSHTPLQGARYTDYPDYPTKESYPPADRPYGSSSAQVHAEYPTTSAPSSGARQQQGRFGLDAALVKGKGLCSCSGEGGVGKGMMIGWVVTTVLVLLVLACWRGELFEALDNLSKTLAAQGLQGKLAIFGLILITTIPPVPLYSTLIILSGYTFGAWEGFVVSYAASLVGAVLVFLISRGWLKDIIAKCLASSPTSTSLLQILPSNPHLLLLIRIAPYPYNLLNVILASSPTLSLRTYTGCTALSLCKLILHTWIGAGIHDLSASYGHGHTQLAVDEPPLGDHEGQPHHGHGHGHGHKHPHPGGHIGHGPPPMDPSREDVKLYTTWAGIVLCVGLFFYLTHLAKKALRRAQEEQEQREREMREDGSGVALLSTRASEEV
ncbi:hypothetical protein IAU60_006167 [Kwoniella sp. DSM 27419]